MQSSLYPFRVLTQPPSIPKKANFNREISGLIIVRGEQGNNWPNTVMWLCLKKKTVFIRSPADNKTAFLNIFTLENVFEVMRFHWLISLDTFGQKAKSEKIISAFKRERIRVEGASIL